MADSQLCSVTVLVARAATRFGNVALFWVEIEGIRFWGPHCLSSLRCINEYLLLLCRILMFDALDHVRGIVNLCLLELANLDLSTG